MTSQFEQQLRAELVAAATRDLARQAERRHRLRRRVAAAIVAAAAAVAGSVAVLWPSPAGADVSVEVRDGRLVVHIDESGVTPSDIAEALRDHGYDARTDGAATGPSSVGRFVSVYVEGGDAQPRLSGGGASGFGGYDTFSVDADFHGRLTITVGVLGHGDDYQTPSDAFAEDEPLHCRGILGQPLAAIADRLAGFEVSVVVDDHGLLTEMPLADALASPQRRWIVARGLANGPRRVALYVRADASAEERC